MYNLDTSGWGGGGNFPDSTIILENCNDQAGSLEGNVYSVAL